MVNMSMILLITGVAMIGSSIVFMFNNLKTISNVNLVMGASLLMISRILEFLG